MFSRTLAMFGSCFVFFNWNFYIIMQISIKEQVALNNLATWAGQVRQAACIYYSQVSNFCLSQKVDRGRGHWEASRKDSQTDFRSWWTLENAQAVSDTTRQYYEKIKAKLVSFLSCALCITHLFLSTNFTSPPPWQVSAILHSMTCLYRFCVLFRKSLDTVVSRLNVESIIGEKKRLQEKAEGVCRTLFL